MEETSSACETSVLFIYIYICISFLLFMYLFIYGCVGSSLLGMGFL